MPIKTGLSENQRAEHSPEHKAEARNMTKPKPLRESMPFTASIIDDFRAHWPEAGIVQAVRAGIDGQQTFHARENGQEVGTPIPYDPARAVALADIIIGTMNPANAPQTEKKGPRHG